MISDFDRLLRGVFIFLYAGMLLTGCASSVDHWQKAKMEFAANDFLGCILELNLLLEQQPATDSILVLRAHCFNRVEKHNKAEDDLLNALALNPESLGAKLGYAQLLAYRGDTLKALDWLEIPPRSDHGRSASDLILERARLLFYTKRYPESLNCLHRAISADRLNAEAWFLRGAFYASDLPDSNHKFYQPREAIHDFRMAISLNPRFAEAFYKLALTEMDAFSDFTSGMNHLSQAIRFDPFHTGYYLERADRYSKLGNRDAAIHDLLKVLKLNPLDSIAQFRLKQLEAK
jgi:tetratricopeptide (TPR) repeat protein